MNTKTLLIILVVIAIVVAVAIWRGQRDPDASDMNPDSTPGSNFFKSFGGGGDTLAIARIVGCGREGRVLRFSGTCNARILSGKPKQSRFVLKAFSHSVRACYGFDMDQLEKCDDQDDEKKSWLKPDGKSRFVVAQDEAFLRLYCKENSGCTVTVE